MNGTPSLCVNTFRQIWPTAWIETGLPIHPLLAFSSASNPLGRLSPIAWLENRDPHQTSFWPFFHQQWESLITINIFSVSSMMWGVGIYSSGQTSFHLFLGLYPTAQISPLLDKVGLASLGIMIGHLVIFPIRKPSGASPSLGRLWPIGWLENRASHQTFF